jgi:NTE family protein
MSKLTLKQFHERINADPARPQQVTGIATDLTAKEVLVLNERTAPDLPVIDAIRMSMGIPFAWMPVEWPAGVKYNPKPGDMTSAREKTGNLVVDGGVLSNFPIRYLRDPRHTEANGVLGPTPASRVKDAIGLFLDSTKAVPDFPRKDGEAGLADNLKAVRFGSMLMDTMSDSWDADALRELIPVEEQERVICKIGTSGFTWLKFSYPYEANDGPQLTHLVNSGKCAMRDFLAARRK